MSKYDYRDPGTDPAYCNALAADGECDDVCPWCDNPADADEYWPYCSRACAVAAQLDSPEDMEDTDR